MKFSSSSLLRTACAASLLLLCAPLAWAQDPVGDTPGDDTTVDVTPVDDITGDDSGLPDDPRIYETMAPTVLGAAGTASYFRLVAPHLYVSTTVFPVSAGASAATSAAAIIGPIIGPVGGTPVFTGTVSKVKIRTGTGTNVRRVKAKVSLTNVADKTLRGITATVYLSADGTLDSTDSKLITLDLGDFFAKNKLGKGQTRKLSLNREVPAALASLLEGKYLIVDLKASNAVNPGEDFSIVVGPIELP